MHPIFAARHTALNSGEGDGTGEAGRRAKGAA
jgi:hypothetical protein